MICLLRRKTVNEKVEWMMYFDYKTGEVIYCWKGSEGISGGGYDNIHFQGRNIASIHSHQKGYYSFPSPENFDILENEFEDYEVITSINAMGIVEFRGEVNEEIRKDFQLNFSIDFNRIEENIKLRHDDGIIRIMIENLFSDYLLHDLDKNVQNLSLNLVKREYD